MSWPSSTSATSSSGWLIGTRLFSCSAWKYSCGSASLTASPMTASRPTRWSMTIAGTLPLRKPGMVTCCAILLYAASRLGLSSSKGTSTVSLTRVGFNVSTALFTGVLLVAGGCRRVAAQDGAGQGSSLSGGPLSVKSASEQSSRCRNGPSECGADGESAQVRLVVGLQDRRDQAVQRRRLVLLARLPERRLARPEL